MLNVFIICAIFTVSSLFISRTEVDPGSLSQTKQYWVNSPISVSPSSTNAVASLTFYFNPSSSLSSGVFCAVFPSSFIPNNKCVPVSNIVAGIDNHVTITGVLLPSISGAYGPVQIFTRNSPTGNILDLNLNFAMISVYPSTVIKLLKVNYQSTVINSQTSVLLNFSITNDLWKNDYFQVFFPSQVNISAPTCQSINTTISNYIQGPNPSSPFSLPCFVSGNTLTVYGLSNDILIGNYGSVSSLDLSLQVFGVILPSVAYAGSNMTWSLSTVRFGGYQKLEVFQGVGPDFTASSMIVNSWTPHHTQKIVLGKFLYMDLVFTIIDSIPQTGSLNVNFKGTNINDISWKSDANQAVNGPSTGYYKFSSSLFGKCSISSTYLECTSLENSISPGQYTLTTLCHFTGSSPSVQIYSTDHNNNTISISSVFSTSYAVNTSLLTSMNFLFSVDNTANYSAYTNSKVIGYLSFQCQVTIPTSTVMSLQLPFNSRGNSELFIGNFSSLRGKLLVSNVPMSDYSQNTSVLMDLNNFDTETGFIFFQTPKDIQSNQYVYIYLVSDNAASQPGLILPYVASNEVTLYEVILFFTISYNTYTYSKPFTIIPSTLQSLSSNLYCSDHTVAGMPLTVKFTPAFGFETTLGSIQIDLEFTSGYSEDLGSGLNFGDPYPGYSSFSSDSQVNYILYPNTITVFGLLNLDKIQYTVTVPIGQSTITNSSGVLTIYYVDSQGFSNEIIQNSFQISGGSQTTSLFNDNSNATTYVNQILQSPHTFENFELRITPFISTPTDSSNVVGVFFPAGYTFESPSVFLTSNSNTKAQIVYYFTSPTPYFAFPSIFFQLSSQIYLSQSTPSISITGVSPSTGSTSGAVRFLQIPNNIGKCINALMDTNPMIFSLPLAFSALKFLPSQAEVFGPSSLLVNISATIQFPVKILESYVIEFNVEWALNSFSTIQISGPNECSLSNTEQVIRLSNCLNIANGGSMTLNIQNVKSPMSTADSSLFSSISVYLDSKKTNVMIFYAGGNTCLILPSSAQGTSFFYAESIFPSAYGLESALIYFEFQLRNSLPPNSIISISSAASYWSVSGDISMNCWINLKYNTCTITNNLLILNISDFYYGGNSLSMIIDNVLDLPKWYNYTTFFYVTTSFENFTVDQDSFGTATLFQILPLNIAPVSTLTPNSLVNIFPTNIGDLATYTFNFTLSIKIYSGYSIAIVFPKTFDVFLGVNFVMFPFQSSTFYISCNSQTIGLESINCAVNHWILYITGIYTTIQNNQNIIINLYNVRNPMSVDFLRIYVLDPTNSVVAFNESIQTAALSPSAPFLQIKNFTISESGLRKSSIYSVGFYLPVIYAGSMIEFKFPIQYALARDNPKVQCSSNTLQLQFSNCFVSSNNLLVPITSDFPTAQFIVFEIVIQNPEWGFFIKNQLYINGPHSFWTNKIEIGVISNSQFIYRSYGQHGFYVGLDEKMQLISVNGYSAIGNSNYIIIKPGSTVANIKISVNTWLKAYSLQLIPSNSAQNQAVLSFSSENSYVLNRFMPYITFSVTVPENAIYSLNYIEWTISENSLNGTSVYAVNYKTLVIVYNLPKLNINIDSLSWNYNLIVFAKSYFAFRMFNDFAPNSDVSVSISLKNSSLSSVIFSPGLVTFFSGDTTKYLNVTVVGNFNGEYNVPYEIVLSLSGTNSDIYQIPNTYYLRVYNTSYSNPNILYSAIENIGSNSFDVVIRSDIESVVYWEMCEINFPFSSFIDLQQKTYPLFSKATNNLSINTQIFNYFSNLPLSPNSNELWQDFQKRVYTQAINTCFYAMAMAPAGFNSVLFSPNFLWESTTYKTQVFVVNYKGDFTYLVLNATTLGMSLPVTINLNFNALIPYPISEVIAIVSESLGVQSQMLQFISSNRRTLYSVINLMLLNDRALSLSPLSMCQYIDYQIIDYYFSANTLISCSEINSNNYPIPVTSFKLGTVGIDFFQVLLSTIGNGFVYCVAEFKIDLNISTKSENVFLGIDRNNSATFHNFTLANSSSIYFKGLTGKTFYAVSCVSTNSFPIWPDLSEVFSLEVTTLVNDSLNYFSFGTIWKSPCVILTLHILL